VLGLPVLKRLLSFKSIICCGHGGGNKILVSSIIITIFYCVALEPIESDLIILPLPMGDAI